MSKIGKQPIKIPEGVKIEVNPALIKVIGAKGSLERKLPRGIGISIDGDTLTVSRKSDSKTGLSLHGTIRALVNNMVKGVRDGFTKQLELVGTGFRAEVVGRDLSLTVGYSHPVKVTAPEGISFKVEKMVITIEGIDREVVGQVAANVRAVRPPEPYKGKGIKYVDEVIRRKPGKAAAAKTAAA